MGEGTEFAAALAVLGVLYGVVGLLFILRRNRKQISSRSPLLVLISQVGNFCEQCCLLMDRTSELLQPKSIWLSALMVFFHFVYYFPYLLRGYRLYFVFHSHLGENREAERYVLKHLQRSRQTWLIKVLAVMLLPVFAFCVLEVALLSMDSSVPHADPKTKSLEMIVIAVSFVEEMLLLSVIYSLRKVDKDFAMNTELCIVTVLWYLNVVFSFHSQYSFWITELICRNTLIMCVSLLWPLLRSYKKSEMKEVLTLEALFHLPIILQNEVPFDYFESFLIKLQSEGSEDLLNEAGLPALRMFLATKIYKDAPSPEDAEKVLSEFELFNRSFHLLGEAQLSDLRRRAEAGDLEALAPVEAALYHLLERHFFPQFQKSEAFRDLCRHVEQMELRTSLLTNTSLYGRESM